MFDSFFQAQEWLTKHGFVEWVLTDEAKEAFHRATTDEDRKQAMKAGHWEALALGKATMAAGHDPETTWDLKQAGPCSFESSASIADKQPAAHLASLHQMASVIICGQWPCQR